MEFKKILLSDLIPDKKNPRKNLQPEDPEFKKINTSIERFGFLEPIVFNTKTKKILGGHQRLKVVRNQGAVSLHVIQLGAYSWAFTDDDLKELSEQEESAANIALNKAKGDWAVDQLVENLKELKTEGMLDLTGFDEKEFDQMLRELYKDDEPQDTEPQISRAEELRKEWGTELGQMWQCGDHRVICGDCTDLTTVNKLMDNEKAELLFTSPPYSDMRTYNGITDLTVNKLIGFISAFKSHAKYQAINLGIQRKDGEVIQYWDNYIKAAKDSGYKLLSWNVWNREQATSIGMQSAFFPIFHEWVFVFGFEVKEINRTLPKSEASYERQKCPKPGTRRRKNGEMCVANRGDTSFDSVKMGTVTTLKAANTVGNSAHPAPFPVGLPSAYIEAMTALEDIVVDPFLGSGTTMIACENLGRKCRGMEIDPGYMAVILQRYKDTFTDKEIRLIE